MNLSALKDKVDALLLRRSRSLVSSNGEGITIIPDVTISELHADRVTVTQHPVDAGANIADHAIVEPPQLHCQFGWSESSSLLNAAINSASTQELQGIQKTADIYEQLLSAMNSRVLFDVSTGKRKYTGMLIVDLKTTTTVDTENVLIVDITFQKVNLVSSRTTSLADTEAKNPPKTLPPTNAGKVSASQTTWTTSSIRHGISWGR